MPYEVGLMVTAAPGVTVCDHQTQCALLNEGAITPMKSNKPVGSVIAQSPAARKKANVGDKVALTISMGR